MTAPSSGITRRVRGLVAGAVLCLAATVTAGCSSDGFTGLYDLPLPGGADIGDNPYQVTARFADVLDLVPQAAVKVNDVTVGRVESIGLVGSNDWTAEAVLAVDADVELPANAVANLRQSSLLGEKYVELSAPQTTGRGGTVAGRLTDGAVIPRDRTNRYPELEEVFGALSLLLNGGGIEQLRTINRELSSAMTGNEEEIRSFLRNMNDLVSNLDGHKREITAALDGINRLSSTLANRERQISGALRNLEPGLRTLSDQRSALVAMLQSLDDLSDVAVQTINRSKNDIVADLRALAPILDRLADAGQDLPRALEILPTFPFTDAVLSGIKGDYLNAFLSIDPDPNWKEPIPPLPIPPTDTNTTVRSDAGNGGTS
ncbi:MAG: MCE family protein [Pseudonocardiaceae bacterium]|nr:MCE family protein [Pseudonocardiaceae bacterium]